MEKDRNIVNFSDVLEIESVLGKDWRKHISDGVFSGLTIPGAYEAWCSKKDVETFPIPWAAMRAHWGDLRSGELTFLTGDTGHGKTTFGMNLIYAMAQEHFASMIFSLEMGPIAAIKKLFTMHTGLPATRENAVGRYTDFMKWAYNSKNLILNHTGYLKFDSLKMAIVWAVVCHDVKVILIDHFHSMVAPGTKPDRIESMAMELKTLAEKLNISLVVICHPAKIKGDGKEREIQMDELKGSSGLKQYADNVLSVFYDKKNQMTKVRLHKIRNDDFGQWMGTAITYSLKKNLLFQEIDNGSKD